MRDSGGPLRLSSKDGSVTASGVTSREVTAESRDGRVKPAFAEAPDRVAAGSRDGGITIEVPRTAYRVDAEAKDGSVSVQVPQDDRSGRVLTARTHDGGITVRSVD